MKNLIVRLKSPSNFEIGNCSECQFARGSDQCKLIDLLTNGAIKLNCFCPLINEKS